jgi:ABC-2 type transport system permease protein
VRWFSVAAPPVAVQSTSAALAGTDPAHHRHFAEAAERHRRALIDMLNRAFAESGGADGWSYQAGRETWARAPRFEYEQPSASWALRPQLVPLSSLGIWFVASLCFAAWASSRVRVG